MKNPKAVAVVSAVYKALVVKHPGHEDQSVHGGGRGPAGGQNDVAGGRESQNDSAKPLPANLRDAQKKYESAGGRAMGMGTVTLLADKMEKKLRGGESGTVTDTSTRTERIAYGKMAADGLLNVKEHGDEDGTVTLSLTPAGEAWMRQVRKIK